MKKGQFFLLVVVCIIVGIAGWMVTKNQRADWEQQESSIGQLLLPDFPINDVKKLVITTKEKKVELAHEADFWVVKSKYSYYADFSKVADFLKKLADLKMLQKIDIGKDDLGRLELNEPDAESQTGTKVEFFDKDETALGKIILGKNHMRKAGAAATQFGGGGEWPDGRYIYQGKSKVVALVSETFSSISDDGDLWLDKTFIKVEKIKNAKAMKGDEVVWEIYRDRENAPLKLKGDIASDEELDSSKLNAIDSSLKYANFNKVADPNSAETDHGFSEGRIYVAETFDGFTYTVNIGKKSEDENYPIKVAIEFNEPPMPEAPDEESEEDKVKREEEFKTALVENKEKFEKISNRYSNWVYMVSSYTVDDLLLERKDLVKKKEKAEDSSAGDDTKASAPVPGPLPPVIPDQLEDSGTQSIPRLAEEEINEVSKALKSVSDDGKEKASNIGESIKIQANEAVNALTEEAEEKEKNLQEAIEINEPTNPKEPE